MISQLTFRCGQILKEQLHKRRERLALGEHVDDLDESELPEDLSEDGLINPKSLLEDLQKRLLFIISSNFVVFVINEKC